MHTVLKQNDVRPIMFLSYSSSDGTFAERLAKDLSRFGINVWFDRWLIQPGNKLRDRINEAIKDCQYFGVVLSVRSIQSRWVQNELDAAMIRFIEDNNVQIIPILVGHIDQKQIPADLRGIVHVDFRHLNNNKYQIQLRRLARRMTSVSIYEDSPFTLDELRLRNDGMISVLFLAADPTDASRLRIGEEAREIQEKLQLARLRDRFELHLRMSVRPEDLSQSLLDVKPNIVHFSGHGTGTSALCFEDKIGKTHLISPDALAALFEQFADQVSCVILNACYSEGQANAVAKHINYVIGMNKAIGDKAAIAFAIGLYQALGAGRSIEEAYKLGCVQIRLQGISEYLTPVLIKMTD